MLKATQILVFFYYLKGPKKIYFRDSPLMECHFRFEKLTESKFNEFEPRLKSASLKYRLKF